jgi:hypothetical protein
MARAMLPWAIRRASIIDMFGFVSVRKATFSSTFVLETQVGGKYVQKTERKQIRKLFYENGAAPSALFKKRREMRKKGELCP